MIATRLYLYDAQSLLSYDECRPRASDQVRTVCRMIVTKSLRAECAQYVHRVSETRIRECDSLVGWVDFK
jgi:hypothetical protein